jgi:hypothetical protein
VLPLHVHGIGVALPQGVEGSPAEQCADLVADARGRYVLDQTLGQLSTTLQRSPAGRPTFSREPAFRTPLTGGAIR